MYLALLERKKLEKALSMLSFPSKKTSQLLKMNQMQRDDSYPKSRMEVKLKHFRIHKYDN